MTKFYAVLPNDEGGTYVSMFIVIMYPNGVHGRAMHTRN